MLREDKEILVSKFREEMESYEVLLLLEHKALKFSSIDRVRREVPAGIKIQKIKNRLARIGLKGTKFESLIESLTDERILIGGDDLVSACKGAKNLFSDNKENIKILSGVTKDSTYNEANILALADLPSLEELQSQVLRAINGVGSMLLRTINEVPAMTLRLISNIENKKE